MLALKAPFLLLAFKGSFSICMKRLKSPAGFRAWGLGVEVWGLRMFQAVSGFGVCFKGSFGRLPVDALFGSCFL